VLVVIMLVLSGDNGEKGCGSGSTVPLVFSSIRR
jgi:hypothetical protein